MSLHHVYMYYVCNLEDGYVSIESQLTKVCICINRIFKPTYICMKNIKTSHSIYNKKYNADT